MNAEVAYRYRERKSEVDALGEVEFKRHALQHLKLKTVLKVMPLHARRFTASTPSCCANRGTLYQEAEHLAR